MINFASFYKHIYFFIVYIRFICNSTRIMADILAENLVGGGDNQKNRLEQIDNRIEDINDKLKDLQAELCNGTIYFLIIPRYFFK